ncbi:hypothetical protein OAF54_01925 [bacterium]|nr:hypothetical protein [bacterium]
MKNKVKKYHRGGSHEDHHAAKVASPTPTPRPKSSELKSARDRLRRLPSSKRRPPRATQTTGQIASRPPSTQPLMQPTQTGQMSPMQRNMMKYALERAKQQAKAQEELRKENEAYRKRVMQGGDKRIKKGSKLDESIRNVRSQQLASYANSRENSLLNRYRSRPLNTQDLEKDKVEKIKLQNEAERIGGTGRRVNLNAGSRRVRRR